MCHDGANTIWYDSMPKPSDLDPPPTPNPRRGDSKAIVESILEAVRLLPPDASIQSIADRAGVGVASIYRYFSGREAIYAELGRRLHGQLATEMRRALGASDSLDEVVEACCRMGLEMRFGERHVVEHVHQRIPFFWHEEQAATELESILEAIMDAMERFLIGSREEFRPRAFLAFSMARGASRARLLAPGLAPTREEAFGPMCDAVRAAVCSGLKLRPNPRSYEVSEEGHAENID